MKREPKMPLLPLVGGVAAFVLGIAMIFWPEPVAQVFAYLLGAVLLLMGAQNVAHCIATWKWLANPALRLGRGIVYLALALVFIIGGERTLRALGVLLGVALLLAGLWNTVDTIRRIRAKKPFLFDILEALFQLVLGALMVLAPFSGVLLLARLLGICFALAGVGLLRWLYANWRTPPEPPG